LNTFTKYVKTDNTMNEIIKATLTFALIICATTTIHWSLIQLYNQWCAPFTPLGFISTMFTLGSPFCQFINYVQYELAKHYIGVWAGAAVAIIAYVSANLSNR
jgi:hypothetical protein